MTRLILGIAIILFTIEYKECKSKSTVILWNKKIDEIQIKLTMRDSYILSMVILLMMFIILY